MTIDANKFPQLARMAAVSDEAQAIGAFIDWLHENGMAVCQAAEPPSAHYWPVMDSPEQLSARHFGIDLKAVERERRQVLADFQTKKPVTLAEADEEAASDSYEIDGQSD